MTPSTSEVRLAAMSTKAGLQPLRLPPDFLASSVTMLREGWEISDHCSFEEPTHEHVSIQGLDLVLKSAGVRKRVCVYVRPAVLDSEP